MRPIRFDSDVISIPQEVRELPLSRFRVSKRLGDFFVSNSLQFLGDLHGLSFYRFIPIKNCGRVTLLELQDLVRGAQMGELPILPEAPSRLDCISVPANAFEIRFSELLISTRLASILQAMKVEKLGDLDGRDFCDLLRVKNCGRKTLREFKDLLKRAEAGEFQTGVDDYSQSPLKDLIHLLDNRLAGLPLRKVEILSLRLGADDNRVWSLRAVASKLQLSVERIRQITNTTLRFLSRAGGPRQIEQLKKVSDKCHQLVCPLTPMLFNHWAAIYSIDHMFPAAFYVRLLGELNQDIPVWPTGQTPSILEKQDRLHSIMAQVEKDLGNSSIVRPVKTAFKLAKRSIPDLHCSEFLAAIKNSRMLTVEFDNPERPQLRLRNATL
jgi:hypothetical protein